MEKVFLYVLTISVSLHAQVPKFFDAGYIKANNALIGSKYISPYLTDWDADGKKDLMLGLFMGNNGKISVYLNSGTAQEPLFTTSAYLKAGGTDITLSAG